MSEFTVRAETYDDGTALLEFQRGRANFFTEPLITALIGQLETLASDGATRAVVLCSSGRHFCAGADFADPRTAGDLLGAPITTRHLYDAALELFAQPLPIVAAVQGAAIGGGLGLALACDFRVASPESRFAAPFSRLGLHQGFGISATLPRVIGQQRALELLYTGRRIDGETAQRWGLSDRLVSIGQLRAAARELAAEIAEAAPLAVRSIRETMRTPLLAEVRAALPRERAEQDQLRRTEDFDEGVAADRERRRPAFRMR